MKVYIAKYLMWYEGDSEILGVFESKTSAVAQVPQKVRDSWRISENDGITEYRDEEYHQSYLIEEHEVKP